MNIPIDQSPFEESASTSRSGIGRGNAVHWCGPTEGCWQFVLEHFRDVSVVRERDLEERCSQIASIQNQDPTANHVLVLASSDRGHPVVELAARIDQCQSQNAKSIGWCTVLGTDWCGHRRTKPLPDSWNTFYWHELYDRILPWLRSQPKSDDSKATVSLPPKAIGSRRVNARVQRMIDVASRSSLPLPTKIQLALVVAETQHARELWRDTFARRGIATVAVSPEQESVWVDPTCVIIDQDKAPLSSQFAPSQAESSQAESSQAESSHLRRTLCKVTAAYPEALRIVMDPFPRWETWNELLDEGADLIVGKPFDILGLMDSIELTLA